MLDKSLVARLNRSSRLANIANLGDVLGNLPPLAGKLWFVDTTAGSNGQSGKTFSAGFKTVAKAVAVAGANDAIAIVAPTNTYQLSEAVTIASAKRGLRLIGLGNGPLGAVWSGAVNTVSLTVNAYDVMVENIKFRPPAYSTGSHSVAAGISLSGAYNAIIRNCLFQGQANSENAILTDGNNANVIVEDCEFIYLNTATYGAGIFGSGYTVGENSGWMIRNCTFHSNVSHIWTRLRQSSILGCHFADYGLGPAGAGIQTTKKIFISGATLGVNRVHGNVFEGTYNLAGYTGGTNDNWFGNVVGVNTATVTNGAGVTFTVPGS